MKKISANIMVFNEERCIKRCIDSLLKFVDEIIIIDTGSSDNTIEIINSYKLEIIKLYKFPWNNSFSEIRNKMISLSTKDIIFQIDADEYLDSNQNLIKLKKNLIETLNSSQALSPMIIDYSGTGYSGTLSRIFLNNNNFYYFGLIHEELRNNQINFLKNKFNLKIIHDGYLEEVLISKNKSTRNIALSKKMINIEPSNLRWHYFLIKDLFYYGNNTSILIKEVNKLIKKINSQEKDEYLSRMLQEIETLKLYSKITQGNVCNKEIERFKINFNCTDVNFLKLLNLKLKFRLLQEEIYDCLNSFYLVKNFKDSFFNDTGDHIRYILCEFLEMFQDFENFKINFNNLNPHVKNTYSNKQLEFLEEITNFIKKTKGGT